MSKNKRFIIFISVVILIISTIFNLQACNKQNSKAIDNSNNNKTNIQNPNINTKKKYSVKEIYDAKSNYKKTIYSIKKSNYVVSEVFEKNKPFCTTIFNDFKNNKNIVLIEPKIITSDYNDKRFEPIFKKCPFLKKGLNTTCNFEGDVPDYIKKLPVEEQCLGEPVVYYARRGFALYNIDFDNNPKNGNQVLFVNLGFDNKDDHHYGYDGYALIDLNKCKYPLNYPISELANYYTGKATGNYSGVIEYRDKYYIYEYANFHYFTIYTPNNKSGETYINEFCGLHSIK